MDKNAIKKYAVWARTELITRVSQRAEKYDITAEADANASSVNGMLLSEEEKKQRKALIEQVKQMGFDQVMEEVAYTWFNRFIALRFMEVNGYLPSHIRVFTDDNNIFKPQILAEAIHLELDGLDIEKVYEMKNNNENDELYKYLIIAQCNELSKILPGMFQKIADYTELLFPDNVLREGSVIDALIKEIDVDDWKDQVQIIGWLYQYYNFEKKDTIDRVQGTIKIRKDQIPDATQIFTPDWVVRYMVQNSLGKKWASYNKQSSLSDDWDYYDGNCEIDEAENVNPTDITFFDCCMGSGHILVYAFELFMQIYTDYGIAARDAVRSIIERNLWGLDIDKRASQLAYFAIMMKARSYDRRFLTYKDDNGHYDIPQPNVTYICESNEISSSSIDTFSNCDEETQKQFSMLIKSMKDARQYGTLLRLKNIDMKTIQLRLDMLKRENNIAVMSAINEIEPLIRTASFIKKQYDIVVTNPPYMGARLLNDSLREFLAEQYADSKTDTYAAFVIRCNEYRKKNGYAALMTPNTWLTINSYSKLRDFVLRNHLISSMMLLGGAAFNDAGVTINSFVMKEESVQTCFCNMESFDEATLSTIFKDIKKSHISIRHSDVFLKLPNAVIDPSFSDKMIDIISLLPRVESIIKSDGQTKTGNNDKYLRMLWEVNASKIGEGKKWCLHAKGGGYRKWYGNVDTVIDWSDTARTFYRKDHVARITPEYLWYKEGITWSLISGQHNSFRLLPEGYTFNCAAPTVFTQTNDDEMYVLGLLNSNFAQFLLKKFNATINLTINDIASIPLKKSDNYRRIIDLTKQCIELSKADWDESETSWDFAKHPLVADFTSIEDAWNEYQNTMDCRFNMLKRAEEEINREICSLYGIEDEIDIEVNDKDVTVKTPDKGMAIKSLISYAVGCMFGRYSLDKNGLIFAGNQVDDNCYKSFVPDNDGIIPICDDEYFEDDIVNRFVEFIRVAYGDVNLENNLRFVADSLGGKGASRDIIRAYFINDFFKDHCKLYQKRPIYWLFDSGKKNGFKCLVYMHRYQADTVARIRTDYVHELQSRYRTALDDCTNRQPNVTGSDKVKLDKRIKNLRDQAEELHKYEEKIHHIADQMVSIDLDDGVKNNYMIFKEVLAPIK